MTLRERVARVLHHYSFAHSDCDQVWGELTHAQKERRYKLADAAIGVFGDWLTEQTCSDGEDYDHYAMTYIVAALKRAGEGESVPTQKVRLHDHGPTIDPHNPEDPGRDF